MSSLTRHLTWSARTPPHEPQRDAITTVYCAVTPTCQSWRWGWHLINLMSKTISIPGQTSAFLSIIVIIMICHKDSTNLSTLDQSHSDSSHSSTNLGPSIACASGFVRRLTRCSPHTTREWVAE